MKENNQKKNMEYIIGMIKKGEIFPINLYSYKLICNCENTEINIYGDTRENLEANMPPCPTCNSNYKISDGLIPSETATMLFLNKSDEDRMPAIILASCTPEMIEKYDLAGKWLLKHKSYLIPKIQRKVNLFGAKKNEK